MSHSITVQRTVTTSSHQGTAFVVNSGLFTSGPGILKLLQLICGIITTGIMGHFMSNFASPYSYQFRSEMFFLLMSVFALITTFCVVLSMFLSIGTASILPRTFFEVVYHFIAFLLLCAASITLLVMLTDSSNRYRSRDRDYEPKLAAAMTLLNGVQMALLLLSAALTVSAIRGRNVGHKFLEPGYHEKLAAASIGLINAFFYLCTFVLAIRSWRLL